MANKVTIDGKEYSLGDTAVFESGEAYTINNKNYLAKDCVYDYTLKRYRSKDENLDNLAEGYVGFNKDGNFIKGYFTITTNVVNVGKKGTRTVTPCISADILSDEYITKNDGVYVNYQDATVSNVYEPFEVSREFKMNFPYGAGDVMDAYIEYSSLQKCKTTSGVKALHRELKGLSVGVEFETDRGLLTKKECLDNGLIPLRDGSIGGLEYVTIPMSTENHLQGLVNSLRLLGRKTRVDSKCAIHYHVGNIPRTKEFVTSFWITISLIQDELFKLQSSYKRDNRGFKQKDYSKPLPNLLRTFEKDLSVKENLQKAYGEIMGHLSMGHYDKNNPPELDDVHYHPADPNGSQKWHVKTRYTIANLVPLIFCNKKTVEFRHHDVSVNANIIVAEMLINTSIVNFVIKHEKEILKGVKHISLEEILNDTISSDTILNKLNEFRELKRSIVSRAFTRGEHHIDYRYVDLPAVVQLRESAKEVSANDDIAFVQKHLDVRMLAPTYPKNPFRGQFDDIAERLVQMGRVGGPGRQADRNPQTRVSMFDQFFVTQNDDVPRTFNENGDIVRLAGSSLSTRHASFSREAKSNTAFNLSKLISLLGVGLNEDVRDMNIISISDAIVNADNNTFCNLYETTCAAIMMALIGQNNSVRQYASDFLSNIYAEPLDNDNRILIKQQHVVIEAHRETQSSMVLNNIGVVFPLINISINNIALNINNHESVWLLKTMFTHFVMTADNLFDTGGLGDALSHLLSQRISIVNALHEAGCSRDSIARTSEQVFRRNLEGGNFYRNSLVTVPDYANTMFNHISGTVSERYVLLNPNYKIND